LYSNGQFQLIDVTRALMTPRKARGREFLKVGLKLVDICGTTLIKKHQNLEGWFHSHYLSRCSIIFTFWLANQ